MSLASHVSAHEQEVIRLYDIALPEEQAKDLSVTDVESALGAGSLNASYVDIVSLSALDELGVRGYLTEGLGIPADSLSDYQERLDQIEHHFVVVLSKAFDGRAATLKNGHPLRLIGAFTERKAETFDVDLSSEAAIPQPPKPKKQKSEAAQSGMVATAALLFLFAFVALIVWIA